MNAITSGGGDRFAVSPDGQRFYYSARGKTDRPSIPPVTVTLNWLPR
jgi:hypothetical protein